MTYAQCLADARDLKATMERWGVRCSIELQPGRGSDPWGTPTKYLRMHHHTASRYRAGGSLTPILGVVKNGRPDVQGPLANGYGGYDLVYRILCMGLANHPGRGGPVTIDGVRIPADSARGPTWGTEWEGGYQDYSTIPGMLEFMGRADNALAEWARRPITSQLEHSTWTTRKIDRLNFDRPRGIALTSLWRGGSQTDPEPEEEEVKATLVKAKDHSAYLAVTAEGLRWIRSETEANSLAILGQLNSAKPIVLDRKVLKPIPFIPGTPVPAGW